jgi:anti-sigma regulatory factor (Ser/Thr protein kinase)
MNGNLTQLSAGTIDDVLDQVFLRGVTHVDLRNVRSVDPFALLLLTLLVLEARERGIAVRFDWPQAPDVRAWMRAMGFFAQVGASAVLSTGGAGDALQPIAEIEDEAGIGHVIDGFHDRLAERYPLTESSRRTLTAILIELFQNIPHHSNATGQAADPHGLAAMQDDAEAITVAIADKGIGLRGSLGLRPGYEEISDAGALDAILRDGISRFADAGRGGELQRIIGVVRSWDGSFALRSGSALLYFDERGGDIVDVPPFPGVQLAIRIPLRCFDEPPVDP